MSKSSKVDRPQPGTMPVVSWDFSQKARPGELLKSEPNRMILAFHGRAWDERGVMGTSRTTVPRRQIGKIKVPSI